MNHDLQARRDALSRDAGNVYAASEASAQSIKASMASLNAGMQALTQDIQRPSRAGVRVTTAGPDDLDQRRTALLFEGLQRFAAQSNEHSNCAVGLSKALTRALALIGDMAAELDGPEHAAAVRAEAELQAEIEAGKPEAKQARHLEYLTAYNAAHDARTAREMAEHRAVR